MLTESNLQELLDYQAKYPVVSVYLNTDPVVSSADAYRIQLRNLLKDIDLSQDVTAIERYFEHEFDWSGRSVAVFSCAPEKFFRSYPLAVPIRSRVRVSSAPHVKPLADLLDFYGGYGVALVDKQGARLFYFHLGQLRKQEGVLGESIRHTKRGGASSMVGRRGGVAGRTNHVEEATERNMKDVVDTAAHFFSDNNIRRVLIGGTDDNVALFRSLLPKSWQSLIVGTFPMSMTASAEEVMSRTMEIGQQAEDRQEIHLVQTVQTNSAKKRAGVIHLEDTLSAVHDGRVQILVVREGYRAPGFLCLGCGYLTAAEMHTCPFCGNKFDRIQDAVEMAVRKAMQQGSDVEFIHNEQAAERLSDIGAILRY